jgi:CcmD family protein
MKKAFLTACFSLIFAAVTFGQRPEGKMAEGLRASGKIYVVVGIIVIIFLGIVFYLLQLDRKLRKLENKEK